MKKHLSGWLPEGKQAAVCFSIDDIHSATSSDAYEAGADLQGGALRHVLWLLERHTLLRVTLFTTADWREISPAVTRRFLAHLPFVSDRIFLAEVLPKGTMRLDRHREFTEFLKRIPRAEIGLHGLHHVHRGARLPVEFQEQNAAECEKIIREALEIFGLRDGGQLEFPADAKIRRASISELLPFFDRVNAESES